MKDLWPDFTRFVPSRSPMTILNESGSMLSEKTNRLVTTNVRKRELDQPDQIGYLMYLVAPSLGNYSLYLLDILHPTEMYPITISVDSKIGRELSYEVSWDSEYQVEVGNEEEFENQLQRIYNTERVKRVVGALIAQARGVKVPMPPPPPPPPVESDDDIPF